MAGKIEEPKDEMTITEALAEIKTIKARVAKKRQSVMTHLMRDSKVVDPLSKDGGQVEHVARERQGIADLERRLVAIRTAIQSSNLVKSITVQDVTRTVQEWLNWRREVSQESRSFLDAMRNAIDSQRRAAQNKGYALVESRAASGDPEKNELVVNVSEKDLIEDAELMETILGELDGRLSLANATTSVKIGQ